MLVFKLNEWYVHVYFYCVSSSLILKIKRNPLLPNLWNCKCDIRKKIIWPFELHYGFRNILVHLAKLYQPWKFIEIWKFLASPIKNLVKRINTAVLHRKYWNFNILDSSWRPRHIKMGFHGQFITCLQYRTSRLSKNSEIYMNLK